MNQSEDIVGLDQNEILEMTADIVSSFVSNNPVHASALPEIIKTVYGSLHELVAPEPKEPPRPEPAVSISKSVTPEHIICLEDGKKLKMLKRYLRTRFNMTPDEYRARWNLPSDYPMVAPNYAERRSRFAKESGLGRKRAAN
ncbi:MAG: MucR family transcriptional regulator [Pseudomonadota bacterium]